MRFGPLASPPAEALLDNHATHKHPGVRSWLGTRTRFHLHFTPTSARWLNQVECWFSIIARRAITHGPFNTVSQLAKTIEGCIEPCNQAAKPVIWVAAADPGIHKLNWLTARISGTDRQGLAHPNLRRNNGQVCEPFFRITLFDQRFVLSASGFEEVRNTYNRQMKYSLQSPQIRGGHATRTFQHLR